MAKNDGKTLFQIFCPKTNLFYKIYETKTWPVLEISGIKMHCVKGTDPKESSHEMVSLLGKVSGRVLDTCAGLGYTATVLAGNPAISEVITFEIDENVLELARKNPFSKELFSNHKIKLVHKDVFFGIDEFSENHFNAILHDPPTIKTAGELYSKEFYAKLFRVLKPSGYLFHYTGEPGSKSGIDIVKGVIKRLSSVGFTDFKRTETIKGVFAVKPKK